MYTYLVQCSVVKYKNKNITIYILKIIILSKIWILYIFQFLDKPNFMLGKHYAFFYIVLNEKQ